WGARAPARHNLVPRVLDASRPVEIHRMSERSIIVLSGKEGPDRLVAETTCMTNPEALKPAEGNQWKQQDRQRPKPSQQWISVGLSGAQKQDDPGHPSSAIR